jgi:8-oxo-dGTP diphosphatase
VPGNRKYRNNLTPPNSFTIRVYGLLIHEGRILLSRENIFGDIYTKFPGGGLEFGEGVTECLVREFLEETGVRLSSWELFHINEGYLSSAFHHSKQVLVIYYLVQTDHPELIATADPGEMSLLAREKDQVLFWRDLQELADEPLNLGADREVALKLPGL